MTDYRVKGKARGHDRRLTPPILLLTSPQGSWRESCASGHDPSKVKEELWSCVVDTQRRKKGLSMRNTLFL